MIWIFVIRLQPIICKVFLENSKHKPTTLLSKCPTECIDNRETPTMSIRNSYGAKEVDSNPNALQKHIELKNSRFLPSADYFSLQSVVYAPLALPRGRTNHHSLIRVSFAYC